MDDALSQAWTTAKGARKTPIAANEHTHDNNSKEEEAMICNIICEAEFVWKKLQVVGCRRMCVCWDETNADVKARPTIRGRGKNLAEENRKTNPQLPREKDPKNLFPRPVSPTRQVGNPPNNPNPQSIPSLPTQPPINWGLGRGWGFKMGLLLWTLHSASSRRNRARPASSPLVGTCWRRRHPHPPLLPLISYHGGQPVFFR